MINKIKMAAIALAAASLAALPVFAAPGAVAGPSVTFDKYLILKKEAEVPNLTVEFEVSSGEGVYADQERPQIEPGLYPQNVRVGSAVFAPGDATNTSPQANNSTVQKKFLPVDGVTFDSVTEKYAKKSVPLDFSGVTYTVPGIYRYVLREKTPVKQGVSIDDGESRVIDVYVDSDSEGNLSIQGTVMHRNSDVVNKNGLEAYDASTKPTGFTNRYSTNNLTISKSVTGKQGDRSRYFEFIVSITGAEPGTVYHIENAEEIIKYGVRTVTNPITITVDNDGTAKASIWLKDKQSARINGITAETMVSVDEADAASRAGYTVSAECDGKNYGGTHFAMAGLDHSVAYTNNKDGNVPTGIIQRYLPFGLMIAGAMMAAVLMIVLSRKEENDD